MLNIEKLFLKKDEEEIILILRKYWLSLVKPLTKGALFLIIPAAIASALFGIAAIFSGTIISLVAFVWLVIGLTYISYEIFLWYFDVYIITNSRIINIEQKTLFSRSVSEAALDKIQDVTYEVSGIAQTLFNFGRLQAQTAGAQEVIVFDEIRDPKAAQETINSAVKKYTKEHGGDVTATELIDFIKKQKVEEGEIKKEQKEADQG